MSKTGRKKQDDSGSGGAPEWMVTFSDCMTLLLTFFVLLLSFSSFDDKVFKKLRVIFAGSVASLGSRIEEKKDSFISIKQIVPEEDIQRGSEKPTLEYGKEDTLKKETLPTNFRDRNVFLLPSAEIFWGRGKTISSEGGRILSNIAAYLSMVRNRIVVSEVGGISNKSSPVSRETPVGNNGKMQKDEAGGSSKAGENFGLARAWSVLNYLSEKGNLDRARFSLSATGLVTGGSESSAGADERMVEIVLLNRSLYR